MASEQVSDSESENSSNVKSVEKNDTSNTTKSTSAVTNTSPYYLGPSDNPGTPLVATTLKGENHRNWARSMRTALRAKSKLGFIDGSIKKPAKTSPDFYNWEKADSMVMAWIINAVDPVLHGSISHASTAKDIWEDLEERFAQTNAPRIHQLWRMLCLMEYESDMTVTEYYTKFKSLLDELGELQPLPECTCGASKEIMQREGDQQVHLFLGSLNNERFEHVKAAVLNTDPLPSLRRVFNHVLREEARIMGEKERMATTKRESGGSAFYASNQNRQRRRDGSNSKCDHCGKTGHIKAGCFEIIGYPENWHTRRTQRRSRDDGGQSSAHHTHATEETVQGRALHGSRVMKHDFCESGKNTSCKDLEWVLDSGASHHMTPLLSLMRGVTKIEKPFYVTIPTGNTVLVEMMGTIDLSKDITLQNVLLVPKFDCNLISICQLTRDLNCFVTYHPSYCMIQDFATKKKIGLGDVHGGVYVLKQQVQGSAFTAHHEDNTALWHARMGHPSPQVMQRISQLVNFNFCSNKLRCCDICHRSKQCRLPFHISYNKAENPFDLIHCDLWGKYRTSSHSGCHYFLTIVDDYSRGTWVYLLKEKTEVLRILTNFINMINTQFNVKIKRLRSDNGTEFTNHAFQGILQQEGILHETSCVGTPQQNARVERKHRHILNVARALRFQANLPISFWGECVLAATYLINRTPSMINDGLTPYEKLLGKPPSYEHIKTFGCLCYVKNSNK
jgi:hypothetical protein